MVLVGLDGGYQGKGKYALAILGFFANALLPFKCGEIATLRKVLLAIELPSVTRSESVQEDLRGMIRSAPLCNAGARRALFA